MAYSWGSPLSLRGPQGPQGVGFTTTSGKPSSPGQDGETRVDPSTFTLWTYSLANAVWTQSASFAGTSGVAGSNAMFFYGNAVPTASSPSVPAGTNAIYLQSNGEIWTWSAGANQWQDTGENWVGPQGPKGQRGSVTFAGNGPPPSDPSTLTIGNVTGAMPGDQYLDKSAEQLYFFS